MAAQELAHHETDESQGKPLFQLIQDVMPYRRGVRGFSQIERSEWMRLLSRLARRYSQEALTSVIRKGYREGFFQKGVYPDKFAQYVSAHTPSASRIDKRTAREWAWRRAVDKCRGEARGIGLYAEEYLYDQIRHCSRALEQALVDESLDEEAAHKVRREVRPRIDAVLVEHFGDERIERWRKWSEECRRGGEKYLERIREFRRCKERVAAARNASDQSRIRPEVVTDASKPESLMPTMSN
jgi:hypothetical protein